MMSRRRIAAEKARKAALEEKPVAESQKKEEPQTEASKPKGKKDYQHGANRR